MTTQTRTFRTLVLATLAATTLAGAVRADERSYVTPPLYRAQARVTATVRPASELTTTPSLTPGAPETRRIVAEASETSAR